MKYRLLYIIAEDVGLRSKGLSGWLSVHDDIIRITGPQELSVPCDQVEHLRIFRQHKLGTIIHLQSAATSVFLTVPRFNVCGIFAVINHRQTHALFGELRKHCNVEPE